MKSFLACHDQIISIHASGSKVTLQQLSLKSIFFVKLLLNDLLSNAIQIIIDDLRSRYACPVRQNIKSRQSDRFTQMLVNFKHFDKELFHLCQFIISPFLKLYPFCSEQGGIRKIQTISIYV